MKKTKSFERFTKLFQFKIHDYKNIYYKIYNSHANFNIKIREIIKCTI